MKLYYPVYDRGWKIGTVDSDLLHFLWHCDNGGYDVYNRKKVVNGIEHTYGPLMDSDRLYTDKKGVELYIAKEYARANEYLYFKKEVTQ